MAIEHEYIARRNLPLCDFAKDCFYGRRKAKISMGDYHDPETNEKHIHGQNAVTIQSIEKGRFETDGEVSPRIDPKRPETFVPIEISIPWKYRLRIQMADNSVNTVYTNDMEAEWLLYLMSSQKAIDRYRSMAFSGKWDAALLEVQQMCNSFVNSATNVSATDSLGNLAGYRAEPKS
jgi:hypothetical protein